FAACFHRREGGSEERHRMIRTAAGAIVILSLAGAVFSEIRPLGFVLLLQPVRSFQFLEYFAVLYAAADLDRGIERRDLRSTALVLAGLALWSLYGADDLLRLLVLALVLSVWIAGRRRHRGALSPEWRAGRTAMAPAAAAAI